MRKIAWYWPIVLLMVTPLVSEFFCPLLTVIAFVLMLGITWGERWSFGVCGWLVVVFIAYQSIGLIYTGDRLSTASSALMWFEGLLALLTVSRLITTKDRLYRCLEWLTLTAGTVGVLAVVVYGLYRTGVCDAMILRLWNPVEIQLCKWLPFDIRINLTRDFGRAAATFSNPNMLCEYLVMVFPFAACAGLCLPERGAKLRCRAALIGMTGGIAVTFSRGGYLAVLLFVVFTLFAGRLDKKHIFLAAVSLAALVPQTVLDRLSTIGDVGDTAISSRLLTWQITVAALPRYWLFGAGAGIMSSWSLLRANGTSVHHTHNLVLQLLLEGGIIGLGIVAAMGARMVQVGVKMMAGHDRDRHLGLALVGFFITFVTHGMFDWPLMCPKAVTIFTMILALCDVIARLYLQGGIRHGRSRR